MRSLKVGITGLTQKDAIFQIAKSIAGELYRSDVPMKPLLWKQTDHEHGRIRSPNCPFNKIVEAVYSGLLDGSIPSEIKTDHERRAYSSRIVHYWLKHDKRLNGGQVGSRIVKSEQRLKELEWKLKSDDQLKTMKKIAPTLSEIKQLEMSQYIMGRTFKAILEVYDVSVSELPESLLEELKIVISAESEKKAS